MPSRLFINRLQKVPLGILITLALLSCKDVIQKKDKLAPDEVYGQLFKDVQLAAIFPDSKTFVDCIPKNSAQFILNSYEAEKLKQNFSLEAFVREHFEIPENKGEIFRSDTSLSAKEHIEKLWYVLERKPYSDDGSLLSLRKPYIVPGGRFREIYYWDSYFTMLGLAQSKKDTLIDYMLINFAQLIQDYNHIPNGNRTYYLSRSQPPFFAAMVNLLANVRNDDEALERFLPQLQREYQYWMSALDKGEVEKQNELKANGEIAYKKVVFIEEDQLLNRYYDEKNTPRPEAYKEDVETAKNAEAVDSVMYRHLRSGAESGWDYSSRWFKDPQKLSTIHTTDIIPVDLNALLFNLEKTLEKAYRNKGETYYADNFKNLQEKRKAMIDKYCWNEEKGFYFDYDFVAGEQKEVYSLAAVYPLYFGLASKEQAAAVAKVLEEKFLQAGGLPATLNFNGQQWDAPNGWAPLQWLAIQGLRNYGHNELAETIKERWVANNIRVYKNTGKMVEKYNVYDLSLEAGGGEYPVQDGFGWTNGVLLQLLMEE